MPIAVTNDPEDPDLVFSLRSYKTSDIARRTGVSNPHNGPKIDEMSLLFLRLKDISWRRMDDAGEDNAYRMGACAYISIVCATRNSGTHPAILAASVRQSLIDRLSRDESDTLWSIGTPRDKDRQTTIG